MTLFAALLAADPKFEPLQPSGPVADRIQDALTPIFWVSVVFFFGVAGLILYAAIRFRRKHEDDEEPVQVHGNNRLETIWTATPFVILATLFVVTFLGQDFIKHAPAGSMRVNLYGVRYSWIYDYRDLGNGQPANTKKGKPVEVVSGGTDPSPFVVPAGANVELTLDGTSTVPGKKADVIHSYYIPALAGQINFMPGQQNHLWFNAATPGDYYGQCTELCGEGHATMLIYIKAVSQAEFDSWLKKQESA